MNKNDLDQALLQLALTTGGDPDASDYNLTGFLNISIPVFIDRLECSGAYVLQSTGESLQVLYSSSPAGRPGFPLAGEAESLYREFRESGTVECYLISRELIYHIFYLKNFGLLILSRETQLDNEFLDRLPPVVNLLAGTCRSYLNGRKNMVHQADAARSADITKATFLANISHEIRTPLNAIMGMIRLLHETSLDEHQLKLIENMHSASDSLLTVINDILEFSSLDSGQIDLVNTDFSIHELFRRVYDANEYKAGIKNITLHYSVGPEIPEFFCGDHVRLLQILNYLVGNAIKFTQVGKVEFHCRLTGSVNGKSSVMFAVEDTGIGIDAENLERIFNSFQQEDDSMTRTYGGTGLGLAISKQLVELMGGALHAESAKNQGSKFYFTLDLEKGQSTNLEPKPEPMVTQAPSLRGIRVLLVEDNIFNQLIVEAILDKWGAACRIAEDGQKAVDMVGIEKFDLILMDIQMPVMDGFTASTFIRNNLKIHTPILALTASVVKGVIEPFEKAGMQGYISKPFEEEELYAKIRSVLALPAEGKGDIPGQSEQIQLCDVSRLTKLVGNDAARLKRMIEKFLEVTPAYVSELSEASDHLDLDAISRTSHKMKSSIDLVSNDTMRNLIQTINDISASGTDNGELFELIQKFLIYFQRLTEQLKEFV